MHPHQKARLAVIDEIMSQQGAADGTFASIKTSIISFTQKGDDWQATVEADAHTDRNYLVSYKSILGYTTVETYIKSDQVRWIPDEPTKKTTAPDDEIPGEYLGTM